MVMGGTVYTDAAGTTPAASVEVRLVAGATVFTAYTNATGNFYVFGNAAASSKVGVRDGAKTHVMIGAAANGNCNGCHDGTTTAKIHLP
jgi:hypothetical protein